MARVERGNVVLRVKDEDVQHYLNQGYNLTDENGKIIQRSIPTNLGELQTLYIKQTTQIAELENMVAQLSAKITTLETKLSARKSASNK